MNLSPGSRIGRYEVRAALGSGGMGEVYLAHDSDLERDVAVKVLREASDSGDRVRRFIQEAKAASALNHPNVAHVYEIGSHDGMRFIAMELVGGETLRDRLGRGPMAIDDALQIGTQIAAGLAAAHDAGIVHRDVKPENVIVRPDGYAKILDFGLAKLREVRPDDADTLLKTEPGITMGTLGYMAPEQLSGGDITPAADVFSLGVVLYEMLSGHRPFDGRTSTEIVTAVLSKSPRPLHELRAEVPPKLERVIARALAKNAGERYPAAGAMFEDLRQISREAMSAGVMPVVPGRQRRRAAIALVALGVVLLIAAAVFIASSMMRSRQRQEAEAMLAAAEAHLERREFAAAYDAAVAAASILPEDDRLRDVIGRSSGKAVIESDPPGATVFLQRMNGPRQRVGVTPIEMPRLPHGDYIVTLEKDGYETETRPLTTTPLFLEGRPARHVPGALAVKLSEKGALDPGMVRVQGGEYRLVGWMRPSDQAAQLDDFLIDRFEVSNRDFEEFLRAGGYRRRELWKHPFVDGQKTLSFAEAMQRFRDTTGLPGPRHWVGGAPPRGLENHPVTNITWYEAAAFAEWKGKKLPTIYQWEKAARDPRRHPLGSSFPWGLVGQGVDISDHANFVGKGTVPVDGLPFGISPWGAYNMAGNVAEWCRNRKPPGFAVRGGGWNDAAYAFGATGSFPPLYSSATIGFRCVKELRGSRGDQGSFDLAAKAAVPKYQPVDAPAFEAIRRRYDYVKQPLNARIVETTETPAWTQQKIEYTADGKTVPAYLYLPKGVRPPYQVIHFSPGGDVVSGIRPLNMSMEMWLGAFIRSGRAAFGIVREGYIGRNRSDSLQPDPTSVEYADWAVAQVTEMRRFLDYLEERKDIDMSKMAFIGTSAGTVEGILLTGVESRYRAVLLHGTPIRPYELAATPAASRINFAPRISGAKLMIHGRYDEVVPLESEGQPLFDLLREPKRLELYDGGHAPAFSVVIPKMIGFLDETLGPVE